MPVDKQVQKVLRVPDEEPAVAKLLGMRLQSVGSGVATFVMDVDERHHNPMGSVHGGVLTDVADAAMGYAVISTLDEHETFTTLELKMNFLRPVFAERLRCVGRVDQRGRTIAYAVADVYNAKNKVVAKGVSTNLIVKGAAGEADPFHHKPRGAGDEQD